ncbi:conserved hypothetical protein [Candidatus Koribacter versatilis Ellin345]|uniref:DUF1800 domain-containing protein n=1 Tax=Koribacter versatilis (strain Ellin345) TaxID=204669 RepID=Q1IMN2_KORVE|nr:DUF1800 domain-containing protein [Candidatus Koribacter versatilis]ABF41868.1 conserved hypothetical protein [Candidatus Koribacter versatilis Ellin345]
MPFQRVVTAAALISTLTLGATILSASKKKTTAPQLDDTKQVVHALNRLTFGPRPGDVDRVKAIGLNKWIDEQLHPDKIDDSALQARLSNFRTLTMNAREMAEKFPPNQVVKQVSEGKMSVPHNPDEKIVYLAALDRYDLKKENKANGTKKKADDADATDQADLPDDQINDAERQRRRSARIHGEQIATQIASVAPDKRIEALLRLPDQDRRDLLRINDETRQQLISGMNPADREAVLAMRNPQGLVEDELKDSKLLRAIYSDRQLEEVMTDFWFNHFNIFLNKGPDRYFVTEYERDVIRRHALGKFKDLLNATAHSPAMMFYLDNAESVGPNSPAALGMPDSLRRPMYRGYGQPPQQHSAKKKQNGLNENYARELMELHTLGVNGGYSQKDVTEVAKVFTGWTIEEPRKGGGFKFAERRHEPGSKYVLGQKIDQGGEREGEHVLEMLARDPHTAHFVCNKLAMRFVADAPPQALVDRMADTFLKKDGDIREVLRTMLQSQEFWAPESYRAKVKTPLEFVVSSVRATGAEVSDAKPLVQTLNQMGMPLYGMQPPTGYSMKADTWVNSAALLARMNFALGLGTGKIKGSQVPPEFLHGNNAPDAMATESTLEQNLLAGDISEQTRSVIHKQLDDPKIQAQVADDNKRAQREGLLAGLILGSPEFQRR